MSPGADLQPSQPLIVPVAVPVAAALHFLREVAAASRALTAVEREAADLSAAASRHRPGASVAQIGQLEASQQAKQAANRRWVFGRDSFPTASVVCLPEADFAGGGLRHPIDHLEANALATHTHRRPAAARHESVIACRRHRILSAPEKHHKHRRFGRI